MQAATAVLAAVILAAVIQATPAPAQEPNVTDAQLIRALLAEVRQLRQTLERGALIGARVQILGQRLRAQEDRVARVSRELDSIRRELLDVQSQQARVAETESMEAEAAQLADPRARRNLESEIKQAKAQGERLKALEQQRRSREAELASSLMAEETRLRELHDALRQLERALLPE